MIDVISSGELSHEPHFLLCPYVYLQHHRSCASRIGHSLRSRAMFPSLKPQAGCLHCCLRTVMEPFSPTPKIGCRLNSAIRSCWRKPRAISPDVLEFWIMPWMENLSYSAITASPTRICKDSSAGLVQWTWICKNSQMSWGG